MVTGIIILFLKGFLYIINKCSKILNLYAFKKYNVEELNEYIDI
jgi:hypothetical protein